MLGSSLVGFQVISGAVLILLTDLLLVCVRIRLQPQDVALEPANFLRRMLGENEGSGKDQFLGDPDWLSEMQYNTISPLYADFSNQSFPSLRFRRACAVRS